MADLATDTRTAQLESEYKRNVNPSYRPLQKVVRHARVEYTFEATPSADDNIVIGKLGIASAEVLPEHCRISSLGGAISGAVKLEAVAADGTITALSANATINDNCIPLVRASGNDTVVLDKDDYLQLTIPTVTAIVATDIIQIDIAYVSEEIS